jgi:L-histidine N-alpha-methyltransferase
VTTDLLRVDVHLDAAELDSALRSDVRRGLLANPKRLPPKYFYDERGSQLFDEITRLPEYYLTRAETEILTERAVEIAERTEAHTLVELGSGFSTKTRLLLDALDKVGTLRRFVPVDCDEATLVAASEQILAERAGLEVHAVVADFEHHLHLLPAGSGALPLPGTSPGVRLVAFLGSTIGNLEAPERARFLRDLAATLEPGDALLLGTDLVKPVERLVPAYNDAAGVTAEFNRNVLYVLNARLGANFVPEQFSHVARWNAESEWMEMWLRSERDQHVSIPGVDLEIAFAAGEELWTEISAKQRPERVVSELASAGFVLDRWWTDAAAEFALSLSFLR